jgi:hypothetical protein
VLGEHPDEALDRPELRRVDHHRLLAVPSAAWYSSPKPCRLVEVVLDRRELPGAPDRVLGLHRDLGPVERRAARVGHEVQARLQAGLLEDPRRLGPLLLRADELLLVLVVARRQLEVEVLQAEVTEQAEAEVQQVLDLSAGLLLGDIGVRVVLGKTAHPREAMDDAGLLEAVDRPELEQPHRQVAVGAPARPVDEVVHRAVHRLEVVVAALHLHRREHRVRVVGQVPGGVEEPLLGDVRRADVEEAFLDVPRRT